MLNLRDEAEQYLRKFICVPCDNDLGRYEHKSSLGCYGVAVRLLLAAGITPTVGMEDLIRLVWETCWLQEFNPFLDDVSVERLQYAARLWLQLCVLEDRLGRLMAHSTPGKERWEHLIQVSQIAHDSFHVCVLDCVCVSGRGIGEEIVTAGEEMFHVIRADLCFGTCGSRNFKCAVNGTLQSIQSGWCSKLLSRCRSAHNSMWLPRS